MTYDELDKKAKQIAEDIYSRLRYDFRDTSVRFAIESAVKAGYMVEKFKVEEKE